jgi:nucleotide-binding universal stress UspA family protein
MKILLAIDNSKHSEDAVLGVARFFRPQGTEVRIVQVLPPIVLSAPPQMSRGYAPELENIAKDARALADKFAQQLRAVGFQVDTVVENGDVRESIIDCATAWGAEIILLGSGGHRGVGRLLLGSVAESVVRHAHCSVLVVRPSVKE